MKRGRGLPYGLLLTAILVGAAILHTGGTAGLPTAPPRSHAQWANLYAALPLSFEANRGQTNSRVDFISRGQGYTLFLTGHEAVLTLKATSSSAAGKPLLPAANTALRLQLAGANARPLVAGSDELPGKANYFIGNDPAQWHTNIPTYAKVKYQGVYPGVDLVYYGTRSGQLEYDFVVAPGADPGSIALKLAAEAASPSKNDEALPHLQLTGDGDLVVKLAGGDLVLHKPLVYQQAFDLPSSKSGVQIEIRDPRPHPKSAIENRKLVPARYVLEAHNRIGFQVGPYDHARALVIDPVLVYATYVGGSGGDVGYGIAVDANLDAYIAGATNSTNFPTNGSPYQSAAQGGGDAFVTKINSAGSALLYSTYLGGSGSDSATAIAVFSGNAFLTGNTTSTNFPVHVSVANQNPFQLLPGGNTDAFVAQLNTTGSSLVYASYLGGTGADYGQGIAVDSAGNAYVTGSTQSSNFPVLNAFQSSNAGGSDAFVAEVNFTGEALVYSTYLGGTSTDVGQGIQVDSAGDAYVAGYTFSNNFPLAGPYQVSNAGAEDAFVTELRAGGASLVFSTYLGGAGNDGANAIALGSTGIYIAGETGSQNFPVTTGSFQPSLRGATNAFVSKFNLTGSALTYSTYLGGTGTDQANGIGVGPGGIADVTGFTESSDFPTLNPVQAVLGLSNNQLCGTTPCADAFVTQLNAGGTGLVYSTYLGGNGPDFGQAIAVDNTGDPYVTGSTSSTNFPAIAGSYKSALTGTAGNAFIAKIDVANNSNISIVPYTIAFGNETLEVQSPYQEITISNMSTAPLTISSILVGEVNNSVTIFTVPDLNNCLGILPAGGGSCIMHVAFTPATTGQVTDQITVTDNAGAIPGTQQIINLSGSGVTAATAVTVVPSSLSFASQNVGTTSAPQVVTVTNTGSEPLNITKISASAATPPDFTETDTCLPIAPNGAGGTLAVSQSCKVNVYFTPTASGTRGSSLTISDNATGSPQAVALTGIGAAAFSLTSPSAVNPVLIGSTQTTFTIEANQPTGGIFNGAIALTCSAGSTCAFNPTTIFAPTPTSSSGTTSTLTISQLSPQTTNPFPFSVTGTSGTQTYTLNLDLEFQDFTLTANPPIDTIQAGTTATYTISVNPLNGFNQAVLLECATAGMPPDATCNWSNTTITPNGTSPATSTLSIETAKYVAPTHGLPRLPGGKLPPLILGLLTVAALALLLAGRKRAGSRAWMAARLAIVGTVLVLDLALVACRSGVLNIEGTTTGNYTVTIQGTLNANTNVVRYTTLNVAVTATAP